MVQFLIRRALRFFLNKNFLIKKNLYDFMSILVHFWNEKCPRGRFYYLITMWVKKTEIKHRKRFAFYAKSGAYSPFTESAKLIGRHRGEKVNKFLYIYIFHEEDEDQKECFMRQMSASENEEELKTEAFFPFKLSN